MTLFVYLATPLFVLAVAGHAHARGRGGGWNLLHAYTAAALLAVPLYPLIELVAATFPPRSQPRLQYARLLAVDHGLPLTAAAAASLAVHWFRGRGRAPRTRALRTHALRTHALRTHALRTHAAGTLHAVPLVASLGGFFSVYAILDQFANHADPSMYRLVLLPMLRLAAVTGTAYLLARAARGARWWAAAVPTIPCVTAAVAYAGTFQQPGLVAVGGAALLAATLPLVFANSVAEVPDEPAP